MDDSVAVMLANSLKVKDAFPKAIAHFMFRELLEDIHAEGRITDVELSELNKKALNRASLLVDHIIDDKYMREAFGMESVFCSEWDDPQMTKDLEERLEIYRSGAEVLKKLYQQ